MLSLPRVLFVCTYKGGRSQIAHAYAQKLVSDSIESDCACFDPGSISREFVGLIKTLGLEISPKSPPSVFDKARAKESYEYIVCLCSDVGPELCSFFRKNIAKAFRENDNIIHWNIPDFSQCAEATEGFPACVESICQEIEQNVLKLGETAKKETHS